MSRQPCASSLEFASATFAAKSASKPSSDGRGPLHLNSMTCSASSLFQATGPFSNSSVCSPAAASSSSSAPGATSNVSASTSMYSISTPNASNRPSGFAAAGGAGGAPSPGRPSVGGLELLAGIDAGLEHLHHARVELVAEHGVLDAAVDARVVVDLHEHVAAVHRLDVDSIEAVAHRVRGLEGETQDLARGVLHGERLVLALLRALLAVVVDLPVAVGHVVAADEQRLAVEHRDAPVELRGHERLHDHQVAARQEALQTRGELLTRIGAEYAFRERAVRLLEHARQAELADDVVRARVADHHRRRNREVEPFRKLDEIHLVAAADDRLGVVDHHHPLRARPAREPVGVVVDVGGLANE